MGTLFKKKSLRAQTLCLFFVLFFHKAFAASPFDNKYNHYEGEEIKRYKVCGERCTGTNFLDKLLQANFPSISRVGRSEFGQKHFLWWFGNNLDLEKLIKLKYSPTAVDLFGSENCLFVVVVRDPYDWLRSFFLEPHYVDEKLAEGSFSNFLRGEWKLNNHFYLDSPKEGQYGEIDNLNPWTKSPFSNVIHLRQSKINNYLVLSKIVDNYLLVKYEDVRDNPEEFVNFVSTYFKLAKNYQFVPINTYKGTTSELYTKKQYFPIPQNDLKFINNQIDWKIENSIGYFKKDKFDLDPTKPFSDRK